MADNQYRIQGVEYTRAQTEYQYFPESYFAGSDVTIYFGDIWNEEVSGIQFGLTEEVLPIYGYNSYTFDAAPRGQRIVQGAFRMPFREAGYLYSLINRIAEKQEKSVPRIVYNLSDQERPAWIAGYKEGLDQLLARTAVTDTSYLYNTDMWPNLKLHDKNSFVGQLQDHPAIMRHDPGAEDPIPAMPIGVSGPDVTRLQVRLNHLMKVVPGYTPTAEDGYYDTGLSLTLMNYQTIFMNMSEPSGVFDSTTANSMSYGLTKSDFFGSAALYAVMSFQKTSGIPVTGVVDAATRAKMKAAAIVSSTGYFNSPAYSEYETQIWGTGEVADPKDDSTYFYSGDQAAYLKSNGFDIYINYGPLGTALSQRDGKNLEKVNFNTTVRALRSIQLTGVSQVVNPSGEPIEEVYTFIAKDID